MVQNLRGEFSFLSYQAKVEKFKLSLGDPSFMPGSFIRFAILDFFLSGK